MFPSEKKISSLIESQFPAHYREDAPLFVQFLRDYYRWLEDPENALGRTRRLWEYGDIDLTEDAFLNGFQKKYIFGIPTRTLVNRRFLIKHILDVYRTKGNIQGYKLLFQLLYNENVDVYLPGRDILRASDGTWKVPKYVELENIDISGYEGKIVAGSTSGTTALVEKIIIQDINSTRISIAYLSNINPSNGDFIVGEKLVLFSELGTDAVIDAPTIRGSLSSLSITNGGQDFRVGQILKIIRRDPDSNAKVSYGVDGQVRITALRRQRGSVTFDIEDGGSGFTSNNFVKVYNHPEDANGTGASFTIQSFSFTQNITYNTDIVSPYLDQTLDSTWDFPDNPIANLSSTIEDTLNFVTEQFGTINSLTNINTGEDYTRSPSIFVRSTQPPGIIPTGNIEYFANSVTVTGTNTEFDRYFSNDDPIYLQSNVSDLSTGEFHIIREVVSNVEITLYGNPENDSISPLYGATPPILISNFSPSNNYVFNVDGGQSGTNEAITGDTALGEETVATVRAINSGFGYQENEFVRAYLFSAISSVTVISPGTAYSNGDIAIFSGGGTNQLATGFAVTDSNGAISSVTISNQGSGYESLPSVTIRSTTGSGAVLESNLQVINPISQVTGRVQLAGIGVQKGNWTTTRGFLNSDKYLQDSYFYQDYSYQLKAPVQLADYRDIIYNTFHVAGTELFGKFQAEDFVATSVTGLSANSTILYESSEAIIS